MTDRIGILCFSPTGTTGKICRAVASGMGSDNPLILDMTLPETRAEVTANASAVLNNIDHLITGSPVYSGKLPLQVIEFLKSIDGAGKKSTAVVVYGNRDYGVSLYRMVEILTQNNFNVIGAGTFIGQHSYSDIVPVAVGRPDGQDLEKAQNFGVRILHSSRPLILKDVPVQIDMHSKSKKYSSFKPSYKEKLCVKCGRCGRTCPAGIIARNTGAYSSRSAEKECIGCMACVKNCRTEARYARVNPVVQMIMKRILGPASSVRREPFTIV